MHTYFEFWRNNPGGATFMHLMATLAIAVVVHEWVLDEKHVHVYDPETSLQIRDTSGNVTHLLCTHPHCHKWGRMDGRHG